MRFVSLVLFPVLLASNAIAARSISIAVPEGKLELINPSTTAVTYDVQCYDRTTGTAIISLIGQSLNSKGQRTHNNPAGCASGVAPSKVLSQGALFCPGSVTYANRATLCSSAATSVCSFAQVQAMNVPTAEMLGYYWMNVDAAGSATSFYSTYDSWGSANNLMDMTGGKPYAPITYSKSGSSNQCSAASNGTGAVVMGCSSAMANGTSSGTLCCPDNAGFASCKVTIQSATGHLQSPQFKGGSPF